MTRDEARAAYLRALYSVAPEAEDEDFTDDMDLGRELELDSMDFLSVVTALHTDLGVVVPEEDTPKMRTISGAVTCLLGLAG